MKSFLLLSFFVTVELLIPSCQGVVYCVKANSSASCSMEESSCQQCQTLQYYLDNVDSLVYMENVTIIFMEGNHTFKSKNKLTINTSIVSIVGRGVVKVIHTPQNCDDCVNVWWMVTSIVSIKNLHVTQSDPETTKCSLCNKYYSPIVLHDSMAVLENFSTYKLNILSINSSSLGIRGDSQFAGPSTGGGAIWAHYSNITLSGNVTFFNNKGEFGAAIFLTECNITIATDSNIMFLNNSVTGSGGAVYSYFSIWYIQSGVNITFVNNSASNRGGAIYVAPGCLDNSIYLLNFYNLIVKSDCPQTFFSPIASCNNVSVRLLFDNNHAPVGNDVYGTSFQMCMLMKILACHSTRLSSGIFSVASNPYRVCLCDDNDLPQCTNTKLNLECRNQLRLRVYPGESFTVSAIIVGYDSTPTVGTVYAHLAYDHMYTTSTRLNPTSISIDDNKQCNSLSFTLLSSKTLQNVIKMYVSPDVIRYSSGPLDDFSMDTRSVIIYITLLPCPAGFTLQGDRCDCSWKEFMNCSIVNGTGFFSWNTVAWMSIEYGTLLYSSHCRSDYCKTLDKAIDLESDSDSQCALNRRGRLCGGCMEGNSLAIGSSQCLPGCSSNTHLALLLLFAAAGFLLVFFISVFNLTVTQGMINGLIFYANIVWTYQSIFFPQELNPALKFLKMFIAWINLDFGYPSCFVNGLDAFWKTLLQFVFPVYTWMIALLIIVAARYSTKLTNLLGNRAIPVLSTFFLLSHMKLLRTVVDILKPSTITEYHADGSPDSQSVVWSLDGNLGYCESRHALLFSAGLAVLVLLILPYTLLLLLMQWIRRSPSCCMLKQVMKLNPVYEAYFAPLKHKHQYWFGVLLLTRALLYIVFALTDFMPENISINLFLLQVSMIALLGYVTCVQPYKLTRTLLFQSAFLCNLVILSGFYLFIGTRTHSLSSTQKLQMVVATGLSTTIAFVLFCCIALYEIIKLVKRKCARFLELYNNREVRAASPDFNISYHRDPVVNTGEAQPLVDLSNSSKRPTY